MFDEVLVDCVLLWVFDAPFDPELDDWDWILVTVAAGEFWIEDDEV